MLGITQGLVNTTTKLFSPRDLLISTAGKDYWWTSNYRSLVSGGANSTHG